MAPVRVLQAAVYGKSAGGETKRAGTAKKQLFAHRSFTDLRAFFIYPENEKRCKT
nr:MAG TPA: hypothetical protein [Bacteriophage sp.]